MCVCPTPFLLQESWDYVGSSRMVYAMNNGVFPFAQDMEKQVSPPASEKSSALAVLKQMTIDLMQYLMYNGHWMEIRILHAILSGKEDWGLWSISTTKHFASSLCQ